MESKELKKGLGLFSLIAIGVGSIIGSGIFILPANMAAIAGPSFLLAILFAGLVSTLLALTYAELGAAFPLTGGPFSLPRLALGDLGGFMVGWGYFLYLFIGTAAIIDIFIVYLGFYIPGLAVGATLTPLGIVIALVSIWIFTFINLFGVRWGGLYSAITTVGKLLPLFLFCLMGFVVMDRGSFTPFTPFGMSGVTLATTLFFWSYTGFESIVVPAGEVRNPARNIPLAMMLTMLIIIVTYAAVAVAFLGMIDWRGLGLLPGSWSEIGSLNFPLARLAESSTVLKISWLAPIIALGAVIATGGAGGTWVLIQGRLPFAMAEEGLFWSKMTKVNRFGVPALSLIFTSFLTSLILILIPHFVSISLIASITAIVPYAAASLTLPILRETKKEDERPFRLPFYRLLTLLGFVFSTCFIYWASWPWTLIGTLLIFLGLPFLFLIRREGLEFKRNLWLFIYLIGIVIISFLGGSQAAGESFISISPLGIIKAPYDLLLLTFFAVVIYFWGCRMNSGYESL